MKQKILSALSPVVSSSNSYSISIVAILTDGIILSGRYLIYSTVCVARAVSLTSSVSNLKPAVYAEKLNV